MVRDNRCSVPESHHRLYGPLAEGVIRIPMVVMEMVSIPIRQSYQMKNESFRCHLPFHADRQVVGWDSNDWVPEDRCQDTGAIWGTIGPRPFRYPVHGAFGCLLPTNVNTERLELFAFGAQRWEPAAEPQAMDESAGVYRFRPVRNDDAGSKMTG